MREIQSVADLIDVIERQRENLNVSMWDVARKSGASRSAYWFVARKNVEPTVASVIAYLRVLGLKLYVGP